MCGATLLVVMGTSGSGKSTVGVALSEALGCPFVDGDDLHPASNVEKMSHGHALTDADREPWLQRIRQTGLQLATTGTLPSHDDGKTGNAQVRKLAEVYETSQQPPSSQPAPDTARSPSSQLSNASPPTVRDVSPNHTAVIACSALKLSYRKLLRGSLTFLSQADTTTNTNAAEEILPHDLKVVHIYLDCSRDLLERRMADRKGHFMKLDMLYSQLDTLQPPQPAAEPNIISVPIHPQTTTHDIVNSILQHLPNQQAQ